VHPGAGTDSVAAGSGPEKDSGMDVPETRYAKTADGAYIAYRVAGKGPPDLVYVPDWNSRLDLSWEQPLDARFLRSLASFTRLIMLDRRGSGLSDSVSHREPPPLEVLGDDIRSVLDAAGSDHAVVFGGFEGGPLCALFAATYPARTRALVLYATYARGAWAPDYPWAWTDQELEEDIASGERALQSGRDEEGYYRKWAEQMVPSLARDASFQPWLRRIFGISGNPGSSIALARFEHAIDIRAVLPTIRVPTLVINRVGDRVADFDEGRWLASQISGATFVELAGDDHPPWAGDQGSILEAISAFLGVSRPPPEVDRGLATVLFTDIVGSTDQAASLGDRAWGEVLERHHDLVRAMLVRFRGQEVDTAGDGFFTTFDGPARAAKCARAIIEGVKALGIDVRAGVHTGEVETIAGKIGGMGVIIGSRIGAKAQGSEVLASQTVKDLTAGSGLVFEDAGEHELKGVPDRWHLYRVIE
jgi:class 3 adenylate cyclase